MVATNRLNALSDEAYYETAVQTTNMVVKGHMSPEKAYKQCHLDKKNTCNCLGKAIVKGSIDLFTTYHPIYVSVYMQSDWKNQIIIGWSKVYRSL